MPRLATLLLIATSACVIEKTDDRENTVDALAPPPQPDAARPCTSVTRAVPIINANFDAAPTGTAWTETRLDPSTPLVVSIGNAPTPPNGAWLGGFALTGKDKLAQTITLPANATAITIAYQHEVFTNEPAGFLFDVARVEIQDQAGVRLELVQNLNNLMPTAGWVAVQRTVPTSLAGRTVQLVLISDHAGSGATSFRFDSIAMTATTCE